MLKPPKRGLPDPEYADGETMILARVPIYGTADAGRKFWQKFRRVITENNFRENKVAKALYVIEVDGVIKGMMVTHVDDLCWAIEPEYQHCIDAILTEFVVNDAKIEEDSFRFCGKEVVQDKAYNIIVTCVHSTEQITPIRYDTSRKRKMTDLATDSEIAQMRSVIGSLGWIAR